MQKVVIEANIGRRITREDFDGTGGKIIQFQRTVALALLILHPPVPTKII